MVLNKLGLEYIREENTPFKREGEQDRGSGLGLVSSVLCHLNGGKNATCDLILHFSDVFS